MYLSYYGSKDTDRTKNILYYSLCVLYFLSLANLSLDVGIFVYGEVSSQLIHKHDHLSFVLISCAVRHRLLSQDILYRLCVFNNSSWLLRLSRPVNLGMHKLPMPITHFIDPNLQRSIVVGLCGAGIAAL